MAFQDMTPEDQADLQVYVQLVRGSTISLRKAINAMRGVSNVAALQGNALIGQILPTDTVPDISGLPGAQPLTRSNINGLRDDFNAILSLYDETTKNAVVIKAIGSANFASGAG